MEALLALGVSYVNELNHTKALANLKQYITNNPKYAGLELEDAGEGDVYGEASADGTDSGFQEVQNLLLKALQFDSSDSADVWEALGVAANVSRDYETAVDAFHKAIEARPEDYQLWNKLGATLANSNQSDKALPAYYKALQFKPKYARAWLNMAISHSNLQDYDEAARCYLQTLSLNPAAVHCWSYLRVALSCSERWDLIPLAASQDLNAFKGHFDFVMYDKS
jgi:peroxin-5